MASRGKSCGFRPQGKPRAVTSLDGKQLHTTGHSEPPANSERGSVKERESRLQAANQRLWRSPGRGATRPIPVSRALLPRAPELSGGLMCDSWGVLGRHQMLGQMKVPGDN
ncbi:uncharacterized protein ACOB8E_014489 isoform 1-T2 [Sarcophilus harrisii]